MKGFEELRIELTDGEWPYEFTDHDRMIVRAIVFDDDGYFYFVRADRDDDFGKAIVIETSGGGVEDGEDLATAIGRELREELGVEVEVVDKIGVVSDYYNLIHRHNINNYYLCRVTSFGDRHLTDDEANQFHLSTLRLEFDDAIKEYEINKKYKLGRIISNREIPILLRAKEMLDRMAMSKRADVLVTERLRLAKIEGNNIELLADIFSHPFVGKTYMVPEFKSRDEAVALAKRVADMSNCRQRFVYGIHIGEKLIGLVNEVDLDQGKIELGFVISPDENSKGYATETLKVCIKHLLELGFDSVKTGAFEENAASIRVMEKCEMTRLDEVEHIEYRGIEHRCIMFETRRKIGAER